MVDITKKQNVKGVDRKSEIYDMNKTDERIERIKSLEVFGKDPTSIDIEGFKGTIFKIEGTNILVHYCSNNGLNYNAVCDKEDKMKNNCINYLLYYDTRYKDAPWAFVKIYDGKDDKEDIKKQYYKIKLEDERCNNKQVIIKIKDAIRGDQDKKNYAKSDFVSVDTIKEVLKQQKQIILYGPPGTGKTRMAKMVAKEMASNDTGVDMNKADSQIMFVQFHPAYSYSDFVEGIERKGNKFSPKNKIFREMAEKAEKNREKSYVLIIDEINRANVASVMGELMYGIENRNSEISTSLQLNKPLKIPDNLYIIGTMNTADRSLLQIDYALRRRFSFIKVPAQCLENVDTNYYFFEKLFKKIQKDIANSIARGIDLEDIMPGISYFLCRMDQSDSKKPDENHMKYKIKYEIMPLLIEYKKNGLVTNRKEIFQDLKQYEKTLLDMLCNVEGG